MMLQSGAEIMIGPNVKLRFEAVKPRSAELTLDDFTSQDGRTQDDTEDPDQTYYPRTKK
jgi:hypothetical protein